jgi:tryptophan-rich sensory protein
MPNDRRWRRLRPVAVAAASTLAVAAVGTTLTDLGPWYQSLAKPWWQPPGPAFGAIWTVIYALATASAVIGWRDARQGATREWLIGLFALNGFLNVLWSFLFFRLHRPDWALFESAALWLSVLLLIVILARFSRVASLLLWPYLLWVTIATALDYEVVRMNPAFG